jgi:hypothetical protein
MSWADFMRTDSEPKSNRSSPTPVDGAQTNSASRSNSPASADTNLGSNHRRVPSNGLITESICRALQRVLASKDSRRKFEEFLKNEHSLENLMFFDSVSKFRAVQDPSAQKKEVRKER